MRRDRAARRENRRRAAPAAPIPAARAADRAAAPSRAACPTSAGSGRSVVTDSQRIRSVDVPTPSTVAPRPLQQLDEHLDVADPRHVGRARTARRSAGRRRAAAAPSSCCPRRRRALRAGVRLRSSTCHAVSLRPRYTISSRSVHAEARRAPPPCTARSAAGCRPRSPRPR